MLWHRQTRAELDPFPSRIPPGKGAVPSGAEQTRDFI